MAYLNCGFKWRRTTPPSGEDMRGLGVFEVLVAQSRF